MPCFESHFSSVPASRCSHGSTTSSGVVPVDGEKVPEEEKRRGGVVV